MTTGFIPSLFNWSPSNICHIIWAQLKNSKKSSYLVGGGFPKLCRWHTWYPYNTHIYPTRPLRQKLSPGLKDSDKQGIIVLQGCGRWAGCDELLVMRWHGGLEGDINEVARKWRQPHPTNALALPTLLLLLISTYRVWNVTNAQNVNQAARRYTVMCIWRWTVQCVLDAVQCCV